MTSSARTQLIRNLSNGIEQKVLCLGTSNYVNSTSFSGGTWIPQVQQVLNDTYTGKATFYAEGQSGQNSSKGAELIDDLLKQYNPDVVVLGFAINDGTEGYDESAVRSNIERMLKAVYSHNPGVEIIFFNIISPNDVPEYDSRTRRPYHLTVLNLYDSIARHEGILHVNLYDHWDTLRVNDLETYLAYTTEGVHITRAGNDAITTPEFIRAITGVC